jgi:DNA-binding IclR family transcriptional regulator
VFCTYLPHEQVPGLSRLLRRQPEMEQEFEAIRRHGLSLNSPDINGVRTIAAPVFEGGAIVATMAIVGTTVSVSTDVDSDTAQALLETTRELSRRLGNADEQLDPSA